MYVHDIPFTGINRSTVSERCRILEVALWIQEVFPTTKTCNVAFCSVWNLVPHIISVTGVSGLYPCLGFSISVIQYSGVIPRKAVTMIHIL